MVSTCRQYYRGNSRELELIDTFEKRYEKDHALQWYSEDSFAYTLVNKAFRHEDIDLLYTFRLFIGDLSNRIAMEYRIIQASEKRVWTVYRGAQLSIEQLDKLKESEGRHHSLNGLISTSHSEKVALNFAPTMPNVMISRHLFSRLLAKWMPLVIKSESPIYRTIVHTRTNKKYSSILSFQRFGPCHS